MLGGLATEIIHERNTWTVFEYSVYEHCEDHTVADPLEEVEHCHVDKLHVQVLCPYKQSCPDNNKEIQKAMHILTIQTEA